MTYITVCAGVGVTPAIAASIAASIARIEATSLPMLARRSGAWTETRGSDAADRWNATRHRSVEETKESDAANRCKRRGVRGVDETNESDAATGAP